jgi:hypothetical protein
MVIMKIMVQTKSNVAEEIPFDKRGAEPSGEGGVSSLQQQKKKKKCDIPNFFTKNVNKKVQNSLFKIFFALSHV